ncbi:hypothetical protein [Bradyrhizobium quebecense]|uniref:Leucine-binding protein domain-containing protein n=2 Tax=Bradyrhizobium quebecense TaxID=2748629 RepID=A0ABS3MTX2_9BRAD|nr:hypothetical protein [Bradyrhizobium quebecense]UGY02575.1 hypothetical protein J4P68_0036795 [Bradyrhizobium quebecense]
MASRSITCITLALLCGAALQPSRAAETSAPIRVGAVLPFSGGVELCGEQARLGLDLAAIASPTGPVTLGRDHHVAMNMFIAKTQGTELVQVRPLGVIAPQPGCSLAGR